jgi:hypothetical protein
MNDHIKATAPSYDAGLRLYVLRINNFVYDSVGTTPLGRSFVLCQGNRRLILGLRTVVR